LFERATVILSTVEIMPSLEVYTAKRIWFRFNHRRNLKTRTV